MKTTTTILTVMALALAVGLVFAGAGTAVAKDLGFADVAIVSGDLHNGITYHGVIAERTMEGSRDFAENGITTFAEGPVDSDVGLALVESMDGGYAAGGLAEEPAITNGISNLDPGTVSRDN